jgi:predicted PurR-regulated permease PerM
MTAELPTSFIKNKRFQVIFLLVTGVVLMILAGLLHKVLTPVLIGFILAYVFEPLLDKMERMRVRRWLGVTFIYLILLVSLILAGISLLPKLANQSARLYRSISASTIKFGLGFTNPAEEEPSDADIFVGPLPEGAETVTKLKQAGKEHWLNRYLGISIEEARNLIRQNAKRMAAQITGIFAAILQQLGRGVTNVIGFIFNMLLVFVFAFFFMLHFKKVRSTIKRYIPAANKERTLRILLRIDSAVSSFFRGRLLVCLIAGIVCSLGLWISGLDYWLLLGLAAGALGFIPIIGVIVTLVPACAFAFLTPHPWGSLIGVAITFTVVQAVVEPLVGTLILSHQVKTHPMVIIIALLIGGTLFGAFGMILSIPIAATVKILAEEFIIPPLRDLAEE